MGHAVRLPLSDLACATRDVTFVRVVFAQHRDPEDLIGEPEELRNAWAANVVGPHEVIFTPIELHPLSVRCGFRSVEDESGAEHLILVEGPHLVEHDHELIDLATSHHRATLKRNEERYIRMARNWIKVELQAAQAERKAMSSRGWGDPITPESLLDLANEYLARKSERGLMWALERERSVSRRTIRRWLERAEQEGLLPAGILPRQKRKGADEPST